MEKTAERKIKKTRSAVNLQTEGAEWTGASIEADGSATLASRALVFLLCASPVFFALAYGAVDTWALALQAVAACLIGFLWLADAWQTKGFRFSKNLLQLPLLALILIGLIQLLPLRDVSSASRLLGTDAVSTLTMDAQATRFFLVQLAILLIYFAAALVYINNQKRLRTLVTTIIVFGFLAAVFGIAQSFLGENKIYGVRGHSGAHIFGMYINRHHFAALMEMTMALVLGLLFVRSVEKELRSLQIFLVIVMGIALVLTGSRGAMLSFAGILGFLALVTLLRNQKTGEDSETGQSSFIRQLALYGGGAFSVLFLIFGAVLFLGGDNALMRAVGLSYPGEQEISSGRLHFWQTTWQIFQNNPLLGVGLDASAVAYTRYDTWNGVFRIERTHNDYLQILAETGIIGFLCVAAFIALLFRQGFKIINSTHDRFRRGVALGALAGIFGILIHSFFDFPLRTPANAFFFLALAALAVVNINYPKLRRRATKSN